MPDTSLTPFLEYLGAEQDGFWKWSDQGEVLIWHDGDTIAFRHEVETVLNEFALRQLPPFEGLVLLLAAWRGKIPDLSLLITLFPPESNPLASVSSSPESFSEAFRLQQNQIQHLEDALQQLQRIASFPIRREAPLRAKTLLGEMVFEALPTSLTTDLSPQSLLQFLQQPSPPDNHLNSLPQYHRAHRLLALLHHIRSRLEPIQPQHLSQRMRTGLNTPTLHPPDLPLPSPPSTSTPNWLHWNCFPEWNEFARWVRHLAATLPTLHPPSPSTASTTEGIANLGRVGTLDRLVLSEFAYDDDTLAMRIALNEALYYEPESEEIAPPSSLTLLLDNGFRSWGLTRLLIGAIGLAWRQICPQAMCVYYQETTDEIRSLDWTTPASFEDYLASLSSTLHPGAALPLLPSSSPPDATKSLILILPEECGLDSDWLQQLQVWAHPHQPLYLFKVNSQGSVSLHAWNAHQGKLSPHPLFQAKIDVSEILAAQSLPELETLTQGLENELPRYCHYKTSPFLLPPPQTLSDVCFPSLDSLLALDRKNRLLVQKTFREGIRFYPINIPPSSILWFHGDPHSNRVQMLQWKVKQKVLCLMDLELSSGSLKENWLSVHVPSRPQTAFHLDQTLIVILESSLEAFALPSGNHLLRKPINPSLQWIHSNFFRSRDRADGYLLDWEGNDLLFSPPPLPRSISSQTILLSWYCLGLNQRIFLMSEGLVVTARGDSLLSIPESSLGSVKVNQGWRISNHGHQVAVRSENPPYQWTLYNLLRPSSIRRSVSDKNLLAALHPETHSTPPLPSLSSLRFRFDQIGINPQGLLYLKKNQRPGGLLLNTSTQPWTWQDLPTPFNFGPHQPFHLLKSSDSHTAPLRLAKWPDGSRAWLDPRGILHLKSSIPELPELSLLLCSGAITAWSSDGCRFGHSYFLGTTPPWGEDLWMDHARKFIQIASAHRNTPNLLKPSPGHHLH